LIPLNHNQEREPLLERVRLQRARGLLGKVPPQAKDHHQRARDPLGRARDPPGREPQAKGRGHLQRAKVHLGKDHPAKEPKVKIFALNYCCHRLPLPTD
jgi:hypothetical protein